MKAAAKPAKAPAKPVKAVAPVKAPAKVAKAEVKVEPAKKGKAVVVDFGSAHQDLH
mgnify:CR=1 FL=1